MSWTCSNLSSRFLIKKLRTSSSKYVHLADDCIHYSNHGPLWLEETALPTEPQPLPNSKTFYLQLAWLEIKSQIKTSPLFTDLWVMPDETFTRWIPAAPYSPSLSGTSQMSGVVLSLASSFLFSNRFLCLSVCPYLSLPFFLYVLWIQELVIRSHGRLFLQNWIPVSCLTILKINLRLKSKFTHAQHKLHWTSKRFPWLGSDFVFPLSCRYS